MLVAKFHYIFPSHTFAYSPIPRHWLKIPIPVTILEIIYDSCHWCEEKLQVLHLSPKSYFKIRITDYPDKIQTQQYWIWKQNICWKVKENFEAFVTQKKIATIEENEDSHIVMQKKKWCLHMHSKWQQERNCMQKSEGKTVATNLTDRS